MGKTKKIIAIVSLSIICALILATLILAIVPVSHNINFATPDYIEIYQGNTNHSPATVFKDNEKFNKILEYVNTSTNEKALNSLLNGSLFSGNEIVTENPTGLSEISDSSNKYFINLWFNNPQTLMDGKKTYKDENGKNYLYKGLCFEVSSEDEKLDVKVYVIPYLAANGKDEYNHGRTENLKYQRYYVLKANLSNLYSYLSEQFVFAK